MTTYPTPVKIAAGPLYDALRLQNVLTIETVEAALHDVYKLWEARGMFGCQHESHAAGAVPRVVTPAERGVTPVTVTPRPKTLPTGGTGVRKRAAVDPTPTSVRVHESNAEFARPMLTALRDCSEVVEP